MEQCMTQTLKHLVVERPLAVIDLETTGTDPSKDRIVEISILKVTPDGEIHQNTRRINPGVPIPEEASEVHGIFDEDVADEPAFGDLARSIARYLDGCDLCGFNLKRFDLRVLYVELSRCGIPLDLDGRAIVDPMEIYHRYEPRDLEGAVRFYCGRKHEESHSAAGDVLATLEVLDAMVGHYEDLPVSVSGLHEHFGQGSLVVDSSGFFVRVEGEIRFAKGKHRGESLVAVVREEPGYLKWMLGQDFFDDTKRLVRNALCEAVDQRTY